MLKNAETLSKEYELGTEKEDFYNYIIQSLTNGQREQVKDLFNQMKPYYKKDFLVNFINPSEGIQKSTLNICIGELTK